MGAAGENPQGELEWGNVTFSDPNVVRGLIRCRYKFDMLYGRDNSDIMSSGVDLNNMKQEIHLTYIALDELIAQTRLNDKQLQIMKLFMDGWSEEEMSDELNVSREAVYQLITTLCKDISDENLRQWRRVMLVHTFNLKTRICKSCGESLPATDEFYRVNRGVHYKTKCRKCE